MPFLNNIDLIALSKKINDFIGPDLKSTERNRTFRDGTSFRYNLCTKEQCIKFVDLFTSTSLKEVLQIDDEGMKKQLNLLLNGNTDLIPNQYEGGFKLWEGLLDLIDYINQNSILDSVANGKNELDILDLGCGCGLLSIYVASRLRLKFPELKFRIYLQDYNENVLKYFTIPNVIINDIIHTLASHEGSIDHGELEKMTNQLKENYKFMYGDWKQIEDELFKSSIKFDLILSAETLYSETNYEKLCHIFHSTLSQPNGKVFIASKSHYFGVGGGTLSFIDYVLDWVDEQAKSKRQKISDESYGRKQMKLQIDLVQEIEAPLLRHIIQINWKN